MMQELDVMSPESKVWIYQSKMPITGENRKTIDSLLDRFAHNWVSHNRSLKSIAKVVKDHFIVLMVDETQAGASGCSIDSSVHFIQSLEQAFGLSLFDRMNFAYVSGDEVFVLSKDDFYNAYQTGKINDETLVFDTLVKTKQDFEQSFLKPLKQSWHKRFV